MPTRTTDTQTYHDQSIQCAKFVSAEPFCWKAVKVVQSNTDYWFQFVAKGSADATITIQVGNIVKTQAITTDWTRYVIDFPSITNAVDSLYIGFPAGTYWVYNVQLEPAQTPSAWRPAPEDAEDYADQAAKQAVDDQTQLDIFNKLTNNGVAQGIYLLDGQLYINGEYIAAKTVSGNAIHGGIITGTVINIGDGVFVVDENGQVTAANINITGGTIQIDTEGGTAVNKIILRHIWAGIEKSVMVSGDHIIYQSGDNMIQILGDTISITKGSGANIKQVALIDNVTGLGSVKLYNGGVKRFEAIGSGQAIIYDENAKRRSQWDYSGIRFYNTDGTTITKQL